jgi:FAD/FMN-containing dehydrogenase
VPNADAQIDSLLHELRDTRGRVEAIFCGRKPAELLRLPAEQQWSAAQCLEHLNITNRAYLPRLAEAIRILRAKHVDHRGSFRMDWNARLLHYWLEPPSRVKLPTGVLFQPVSTQDPAAVLSAFQSIGQQIEQELAAARGLALDAERIRSPFSEGMKYNVYSAFTLIAAHNRRHLWQARNAL